MLKKFIRSLSNKPHEKLVIVGGGFGGVKLARLLAPSARYDITLISDRDNFEYHASLCRQATGASRLEVAVPLTDIFPEGSSVTVARDKISAIDSKLQTVTAESGRVYRYDRLVLATGVSSDYFGDQKAGGASYGVKSLADTERLKAHLHERLAYAGPAGDNYVIVGGGPTGTELAGDLVAYATEIRAAHGRTGSFAVHLVESAGRVLPNLPEDFARKISDRLELMGIVPHLGVQAETVADQGLRLSNGEIIVTDTVIWTSGTFVNQLFKDNSLFKISNNGRVAVDDKLMAAPNIFVIGDSADTTYSGWAQTAVYDAEFLAHNWLLDVKGGTTRRYQPPRPLTAIPLEPKWCGLAANSRRLYGNAACLIRKWHDRSLLGTVLPSEIADATWRQRQNRDETCPVCAKHMSTPRA